MNAILELIEDLPMFTDATWTAVYGAPRNGTIQAGWAGDMDKRQAVERFILEDLKVMSIKADVTVTSHGKITIRAR